MGIFVLTPPQVGSGEAEVPTYTGDINNVYYGMYVVLSQIQQELSNIKSSLATIAPNSTNISNRSTTIANNLTTIANNSTSISENIQTISEKISLIESYQNKFKQLAEGEGIHVRSPYETAGFVFTYRSLIEEGRLLSWRERQPSEKEVAKAINDLGKYVDKIRSTIPKDF